MKLDNKTKWIWVVSFLFVSGGFVLGFWPASLLGVIFAGIMDAYIAAILFGLLLDVAYGAPNGLVEYLYFPFTLTAIFSIVLKNLGTRYFLKRDAQERL